MRVRRGRVVRKRVERCILRKERGRVGTSEEERERRTDEKMNLRVS